MDRAEHIGQLLTGPRLAGECGGIDGWRTHLRGTAHRGRRVALLRTWDCRLLEGSKD